MELSDLTVWTSLNAMTDTALSIPWQTEHPEYGNDFILLNSTPGKFLSGNSATLTFTISVSDTAFNMYGGDDHVWW